MAMQQHEASQAPPTGVSRRRFLLLIGAGLNAIAALDVVSGNLAAAKSGSPLTLGWGENGTLLASDYSALLEHTRRMTFLDENQAALLTAEARFLKSQSSTLPATWSLPR